MVRYASLFIQLVAIFNRGQFHSLIFRHKAERYSKGYNSWDHFVAMLFCQLAHAIYKERLQIELFFKALKQNLKGKTFLGTSENALFIQIWPGLIAMLLIKFLQFKSKYSWSLSNLIAFLRWNLLTYRNLWEWIDKPFDVLPIEPESVQYLFPFKGIGQQKLKAET